MFVVLGVFFTLFSELGFLFCFVLFVALYLFVVSFFLCFLFFLFFFFFDRCCLLFAN